MTNAKKNEISFINISKVNCWIVYLIPYSKDEREYDKISKCQQECLKRKIFGMGWPNRDFACTNGTEITEEIAGKYKEEYPASKSALDDYFKIKKDDFVIMRLKNGHYYVGKVLSKAKYIYEQNNEIFKQFSWGCEVDSWVEFKTDDEVPSEIVGRFSQRRHSTIQKISTYRQKLLVISMYESEQKKEYYIPKLQINENNFVRSLDYKELEDLVAFYISDKHKDEGYQLLPSSCKVSEANYEFRFISKGKKPITCQVKSQADIDEGRFETYKEDSEIYEYIYLFSGKWSDEDITKKEEKIKKYKNIRIIKPSELFPIIEKTGIFNQRKNNFYSFNSQKSQEDIHKNIDKILDKMSDNGYQQYDEKEDKNFIVKDINALNYKVFDIDGNLIQKDELDTNRINKTIGDIWFATGDGFFYSSEFNAIILSYLELKEKEKKLITEEDELINKVRNDING